VGRHSPVAACNLRQLPDALVVPEADQRVRAAADPICGESQLLTAGSPGGVGSAENMKVIG